jgi:CheY-like chemotaxis protein
VLVVDDNALHRRTVAKWLRSLGYEPGLAIDGLTAMDALWDATSHGTPFAAVLIDANLGPADGLLVAARIRERAVWANCRIVVMRPWDGAADRREVGGDATLRKPFTKAELAETLERLLQPRRMGAPTASLQSGEHSTATTGTTGALRVLVAEDSEYNADLIRELLHRRGHEAHIVGSGHDALARIEHEHFDILLLDLHMPGLDGFEVIHRIRERELGTGQHLPVIALTARSRKEDRDRCFAAGMDAFLGKPIQSKALWEKEPPPTALP